MPRRSTLTLTIGDQSNGLSHLKQQQAPASTCGIMSGRSLFIANACGKADCHCDWRVLINQWYKLSVSSTRLKHYDSHLTCIGYLGHGKTRNQSYYGCHNSTHTVDYHKRNDIHSAHINTGLAQAQAIKDNSTQAGASESFSGDFAGDEMVHQRVGETRLLQAQNTL